MTKTLNKAEVLIDNGFFTCTRSIDEEGKTEYGLKMNSSINATVEHLVELYKIANSENNKA